VRVTDAQTAVAHLFFSLPESQGFFLAGGLALIVAGAVDRPTKDIDAFTSSSDVPRAAAALETAGRERGWNVDRPKTVSTFARLVVETDRGPTMVELAQDSPPLRPPYASFLGPSLDIEDVAGSKVLALFSRAEARDFTDVRALARQFGKNRLLELAAERDLGFDRQVLAQMIGHMPALRDDRFPVPSEHLPELRAFFASWAEELRRS
jgi:hypothetical protein